MISELWKIIKNKKSQKTILCLLTILSALCSAVWTVVTFAYDNESYQNQSHQNQSIQSNNGIVIGGRAYVHQVTQVVNETGKTNDGENIEYLSNAHHRGDAFIFKKPELPLVENKLPCEPTHGSKVKRLRSKKYAGIKWINVKVTSGNCKNLIGWVTNQTIYSM